MRGTSDGIRKMFTFFCNDMNYCKLCMTILLNYIIRHNQICEIELDLLKIVIAVIINS